MQKLPHEVFSYIRSRFPEGHLAHVQTIKDKQGQVHFKIGVNENEVIHHLNFNEKGKLLQHHTEPVFKEDCYERSFYGEGE